MKIILYITLTLFSVSNTHAQTINWGAEINSGEQVQEQSNIAKNDNGLPGVNAQPYETSTENKAKSCEETSNSTIGINETQKPGDCFRSPFSLFINNSQDSRTRAQPN